MYDSFKFQKSIMRAFEGNLNVEGNNSVLPHYKIFLVTHNGLVDDDTIVYIGSHITNLLTNAIQYNRSGGEVRISLRAEKNHALLTVADNGVGIAAADLPHIFERFYRADTSRSSGNAGLGLAISHAIVTAHGGTLEVASGENAGATFTVRLPLAA